MAFQLEQDLKNDIQGVYKNELIENLSLAASKVRFELNQGVDPAEYEKLTKFLLALEAGAEVLEQVWSQQ